MSLLLWTVLACKDQAMIEENAKLQLRVADLERATKRLEAENQALKAAATAAKEQEKKAAQDEGLAAFGLKPGEKLQATLVTSMGDIACVLRPEQAPDTVRNFVELAQGKREWTHPKTGEKSRRPLYDGTILHRVIPEFMIQMGDPLGNGTGGPGYEFADEVGSFTVFDKPGLLAMANSGPNTNGSQFFVTEGTPTHLNGKHTIFGDCAGLDVVKKIARVPRDGNDRPKTDVVLKTVRIATVVGG